MHAIQLTELAMTVFACGVEIITIRLILQLNKLSKLIMSMLSVTAAVLMRYLVDRIFPRVRFNCSTLRTNAASANRPDKEALAKRIL